MLFADADGATKFSDISKLYEQMKELNELSDSGVLHKDTARTSTVKYEYSPAVVVGSRAHMEQESIVQR